MPSAKLDEMRMDYGSRKHRRGADTGRYMTEAIDAIRRENLRR